MKIMIPSWVISTVMSHVVHSANRSVQKPGLLVNMKFVGISDMMDIHIDTLSLNSSACNCPFTGHMYRFPPRTSLGSTPVLAVLFLLKLGPNWWFIRPGKWVAPPVTCSQCYNCNNPLTNWHEPPSSVDIFQWTPL
jgi:hypothetical protein